uniref:Uncharacterized protein n=1 Tax=Arundo donax TaxID=35708 RepID=A0A0A9BH35_ARUDO
MQQIAFPAGTCSVIAVSFSTSSRCDWLPTSSGGYKG